MFCAVLYTTAVHIHTQEHFLQVTVGLFLSR